MNPYKRLFFFSIKEICWFKTSYFFKLAHKNLYSCVDVTMFPFSCLQLSWMQPGEAAIGIHCNCCEFKMTMAAKGASYTHYRASFQISRLWEFVTKNTDFQFIFKGEKSYTVAWQPWSFYCGILSAWFNAKPHSELTFLMQSLCLYYLAVY